MTDRELGRALLTLDTAPAPAAEAAAVTRRVLARDRRRVRTLAGLAGFFWVLSAAGIVAWYPFYVMYIAPRLRSYHAGRAKLAQDWDAWAAIGEWAAGWMSACVLSMLFAAGFTVWLVLHSRRATLRQINASLAAISEQLRSAAPPATPPG